MPVPQAIDDIIGHLDELLKPGSFEDYC
ncbi:MAG: hypothetical protein QOG68_1613, partial [Solirubrobacteraceae bacterium]|nr:hypothetical protein [Solirubrobacteraceae bacterium]